MSDLLHDRGRGRDHGHGGHDLHGQSGLPQFWTSAEGSAFSLHPGERMPIQRNDGLIGPNFHGFDACRH